MGLAVEKMPSQLRLHIRCENCLRESSKVLDIPLGIDMPRDAYDLEESGLLGSVRFFCTPCESTIGQLFGISEVRSYE